MVAIAFYVPDRLVAIFPRFQIDIDTATTGTHVTSGLTLFAYGLRQFQSWFGQRVLLAAFQQSKNHIPTIKRTIPNPASNNNSVKQKGR